MIVIDIILLIRVFQNVHIVVLYEKQIYKVTLIIKLVIDRASEASLSFNLLVLLYRLYFTTDLDKTFYTGFKTL